MTGFGNAATRIAGASAGTSWAHRSSTTGMLCVGVNACAESLTPLAMQVRHVRIHPRALLGWRPRRPVNRDHHPKGVARWSTCLGSRLAGRLSCIVECYGCLDSSDLLLVRLSQIEAVSEPDDAGVKVAHMRINKCLYAVAVTG